MKDYTALSLQEYLDQLSSDSAIPGGGSVTAYGAALALGLMQMVAKITLKRKVKSDLSVEERSEEEKNRARLQKIVEHVDQLKKQAMEMVTLDPCAYDEVRGCYSRKAPEHETDAALLKAFRLQVALARQIALALDVNGKLAGLVKGAIKNDLVVSQHMLKAAFQGAYHTAHINVVYLKDEAKKVAAEEELIAARLNFGITGSLS